LETAEFRAILVGLEAKKYDFAAHNWAKNAEREAKFLYGKAPLGFYSYSLVVRKDETGINSVSDLEGKNISTSTGSNVSGLLEAYNKEQAQTPINLIYGSLDDEGQIKGITEGRFDAYILDEKRFLDQDAAFRPPLMLRGCRHPPQRVARPPQRPPFPAPEGLPLGAAAPEGLPLGAACWVAAAAPFQGREGLGNEGYRIVIEQYQRSDTTVSRA
ncbi:MAG: transporter substrate-binding domain-containing protein, partial [Treponema sp.]|nr:transporter substrate-binding domain-containing protein [Treponema sp.]